jgi:hypothetical protein
VGTAWGTQQIWQITEWFQGRFHSLRLCEQSHSRNNAGATRTLPCHRRTVDEQMSIHFPGSGAGESRRAGGAAPRTGGEGEEVMHVPPVHTWPAWHGIRHPPQLAWSLEILTHFPKQNICPTGQCWPCAFAANWVTQRNRPIVNPARKARPGGLRPLRKALLRIAGQTRVLHLRLYNRTAQTADQSVVSSFHCMGMALNGRVTWQAASNDENS